MNVRLALSVWIALGVAASVAGPAKPSDPPLRVALQLPSGRAYVGQSVEGIARVVGATGPPRLVLPGPRDLRIEAIGAMAPEGDGDYAQAIRVVPLRPGTLTIPPIRAEVAGRSGASASRRLAVRVAPQEGRPSTFLGGVGRIEAEAEAAPATLRLGDSFTLAITLAGPGAIGSATPPAVAVEGARVRPLPPSEGSDPPTRVFRYRVRPERPGALVVPPLRVSWLDPGSGRYMTTATRGLPVAVAEPPAFDPGPVAPSPKAAPASGRVAIGAGGLAAAALLLMLAVVRRRVRLRGESPRQRAERAIRALEGIAGDAAFGLAAADVLAGFLHEEAGRPPGVVTPDDARLWAERISGDAALGTRAGRAVDGCDRLAYAMGRGEGAAGDVRGAVFALLRDLGHAVEAARTERGTGDRKA